MSENFVSKILNSSMCVSTFCSFEIFFPSEDLSQVLISKLGKLKSRFYKTFTGYVFTAVETENEHCVGGQF